MSLELKTLIIFAFIQILSQVKLSRGIFARSRTTRQFVPTKLTEKVAHTGITLVSYTQLTTHKSGLLLNQFLFLNSVFLS